VIDHHGLLPFEVGEAESAHRGDGVEEAVAEHPEGEGCRLPAGGSEAAEQRFLRSLFIEMEGEGIELAREGDDHLAGHPGLTEGDDFAEGEVLEMAALGCDGVHGALTYTSTRAPAQSGRVRKTTPPGGRNLTVSRLRCARR